MHESMELREHAATVMSTLDQSINLLSDYDNFVAYLHSIGKMHRKVPGFKREHFWVSFWPVYLAVVCLFVSFLSELISDAKIYANRINNLMCCCNKNKPNQTTGTQITGTQTLKPKHRNPKTQKIEQPFLKAVKHTLDERCNETIEEIYKIAIKLIIETIAEGYGDDDQADEQADQPKEARNRDETGGGGSSGNTNGDVTKSKATTTTTTSTRGSNQGGGGTNAGRQRTTTTDGEAAKTTTTTSAPNSENNKKKNIDLSSGPITPEGRLDCDELIEMTSNLIEQIRQDYQDDDDDDDDPKSTKLRDALFELSASRKGHQNDDNNINNNNFIARSETTMITSFYNHLDGSLGGAKLAPAAGEVAGQHGRDTLMGEGHLVAGDLARCPLEAPGELAGRRCPLAPTGGVTRRLAEQTGQPFWTNNSPAVLKIDGSSTKRRTTTTKTTATTTNSDVREQIVGQIWSSSCCLSLSSSPSDSHHSSNTATMPQIDRQRSGGPHKGSPICGAGGEAREANQDNVRRAAQVDCCCPRDASGPPEEAPLAAISSEMNSVKGATMAGARPARARRIMRMTGIRRLVASLGAHSGRHSARQTGQRQQKQQAYGSDRATNSALVIDTTVIRQSGPRQENGAKSHRRWRNESSAGSTRATTTTNGNDHPRGEQTEANHLWERGNRYTGESISPQARCPMSHQIRTNKAGEQMDIATRLLPNEHNHNKPDGHSNINEQSNITSNQGGLIGRGKMIANKLLTKAAGQEKNRPGDQGEIIRMLILINKLLLALSSSRHSKHSMRPNLRSAEVH